MSDPVTNVEIEDVLSSIRRLVSESGGANAEARKAAPAAERPAPVQVQKAPEPAPAPETLDKLVLTPSLRVADAPDQDEAQDRSAEEGHEADEARAAEAAEAEETVDQDVAEEPAAEAAPQESPDEAEAAETDAGDDAPTEASTESAETAQDAPDQTQTEAQEAGESLKDRIQQLEAAVSTQEGEWEEEESAEALPWEDHSAEAEPAPAPEDAHAPFVASEALRAEEPPAEDAEYAGSDSEDAFDFMGGDETLLDEDTLREMVTDIVRQELQGALGERITRNVRKLVRREIHRALMAQEFD